MNTYKLKALAIVGSLALSINAWSLEVQVADSTGKPLGQVTFENSPYGLLITPHLSGLPAGLHGFHIHEHPDCADHGKKAGGHLDPAHTKTHKGPYANGHLGDLPVLVVDADGKAGVQTLAPRLKVKDIKGHALMIHAGGDNYTDTPENGGGGDRIACGKIE